VLYSHALQHVDSTSSRLRPVLQHCKQPLWFGQEWQQLPTETYIVGVDHLSADQQALLDQPGEWLVKTIQGLPQQ